MIISESILVHHRVDNSGQETRNLREIEDKIKTCNTEHRNLGYKNYRIKNFGVQYHAFLFYLSNFSNLAFRDRST